MRKDFENAMVTPLPVLMIGTYDEEGNPNIMNVAWGGQCGPNHITINIGLPEVEKKTLKNIKAKGEFTVSYATKDTMAISDYFGLVSGNAVDKVAETGLTVIKSENIDAPLFEEYPLTAECKVISLDETDFGEAHIVSEIVNVSADESILDDEGNVSMDKLQPIAYDSIEKTYRLVGEVVGQAFADGLKVKK